jgi:hypothetical protein
MRGDIGYRQFAILKQLQRHLGIPIAEYVIAREYAGVSNRYNYDQAFRSLAKRGYVFRHSSGGGASGEARWSEITTAGLQYLRHI